MKPNKVENKNRKKMRNRKEKSGVKVNGHNNIKSIENRQIDEKTETHHQIIGLLGAGSMHFLDFKFNLFIISTIFIFK